MLAYKYRFHGYNALRFVYKNGDAKRSQHITMKYVANPRRSSPRAAVVVSKKIYKKAVGRNRIRRRLYEIIRRELPLLKSDVDLVLIVISAEVAVMNHQELEDEVRTSLKEAELYK